MKKIRRFEEKEDIFENSEFRLTMTVSLLGIVKLRRWTYLEDIRKQT
jgi:hypothetical protein